MTLSIELALALIAPGCRKSTAPPGSQLTVQNAPQDSLGYEMIDVRVMVTRDGTLTSLGNFTAFGGRVLASAATAVIGVDELSGANLGE